MSRRILFAGSAWNTLEAAAAAWAATALPDVSVIEPHEVSDVAARSLVAFWSVEAAKIGECLTPEGADPEEWASAIHAALVERIEAHRGRDGKAP